MSMGNPESRLTDFSNRVVVVTGGSRGLGLAMVEAFARCGADVVIASRKLSNCEKVATSVQESTGCRALPVACHVGQWDQCDALVAATYDAFGRCDVLINNAGSSPLYSSLVEVSPELFDKTVAVNLGGTFRLSASFGSRMVSDGGGCIINNSSIAALRYRQGDPLYAALKAGVTHYTRMAGVELGPHKIRVNSISPGAIATPIFYGGSQRANKLTDEENKIKMEKLKGNLANAVPLKRSGLASDIAEAALYLSSDAGSFVTCQDIVVDGGRTAMFNE